MEENIEVLQRLVDEKELTGIYKTDEIVLQAIENLIKGYKELEKERDSLMWQRNTIDIPKIEELQEENRNIKNHIYYKELVELNYIPKSKVREKIEELKNRIKELEGIEGNEEAIEILKLRLQDMIELLQEGDDK